MENVREIICTSCPLGCRLTAGTEEGKIRIIGHTCPRGEKYGIAEYTDPQRTVTTSVWVEGGDAPLVSVRTDRPVSKKNIPAVLAAAKTLRASAPIRVGETLLENADGAGANLTATRPVKKI
ncbi:MAG: DUF1667 domain-containing protein [Christensenellales bacterium]|jgi:CxxC motif-containing protein